MRFSLSLPLLLIVACTSTPGKVETITVSEHRVQRHKAPTPVTRSREERLTAVRRRALPAFAKRARLEERLTYQAVEASMTSRGFEKRDTVPLLLMGLLHSDERVRVKSKSALSGLSDSAVIFLVDSLSDEQLAEPAAMALGNMGGRARSALEPLAKLFGQGNPSARLAALIALGEIDAQSPVTQKVIRRALRDADPTVSLFAAAFLKRTQKRAQIIGLRQTMNHGEAVHKAAAMMLATIERSVDALMPQVVRAIFSTDPMVRFMAAHAMGTAETRNSTVIRALKRARRDRYAMVRTEASTSLAKLRR